MLVGMHLSQGQHRHSQRPQAEASNSDLVAGYKQCIAEGVLKVKPGDSDELAQSQGEFFPLIVLGKPAEIESDALEYFPGQPARATGAVLPDVLEDVGHLQTLSKRHRKLLQLRPLDIDFAGVGAEKLGQHLADHAGHVITVTIHLGHIGKAVEALVLLIIRHPPGHDADTTGERRALPLAESMGDANYPPGVVNQILLGFQHAVGKQRIQLVGEASGRHLTIDDLDEGFREMPLLPGIEGRVILDGVGNAAQQVSVADDPGEVPGKLRDGKREGPRYVLQDVFLVIQVRRNRALSSAFIHIP